MAYLPQLLISSTTDGTALTASTSPTSILPANAKFTIPAGTLQVGAFLRVVAHGRVSNVVTTPGTLTLDVRMNAGGTAVATSGAMALNIVAKTNVPWTLVWDLSLRASGATGNFMHQGQWYSESVVGAPLPSAGGAGVHMLPNAAPAVGSNFDTSALQQVDLYGTWSINNANSIQVHQFQLWALNLPL